MSVRYWASQDLVLAAVCVALITLACWPNQPTRQMIHSRTPDGNTSSYSLSTDDSRLARIVREVKRWENPPPTREIAIAHWRLELADLYASRLASAAPRKSSTATQGGSDASAHEGTVMQVGFQPTDAEAATVTSPQGRSAEETREYAFWRAISAKSETALDSARANLAEQLAQAGPPPIQLGEVFQPSKSTEAWVTAILLGLLASCLFADWNTRAPAVQISRRSSNEATGETACATTSEVAGELRLEIPIEWIRVHQPIAVHARRLTLAALVLIAIVVSLA